MHLIRSATRFVTWSDRKALAASLTPLYTAENEAAAAETLTELEAKSQHHWSSAIAHLDIHFEGRLPA